MRGRITPSLVISVMALFVALSGTAGAAFVLGKDTVSTAQIKNGSIRLVDIAPATANLLRGQNGRQGPQGPQGIQGVQGVAGAPGVAGGFDPAKVQYVQSETVSVPAAGIGNVSANCPSGTVVVGGGAFTSAAGLWVSRPSGNSGWFAGAVGYQYVSGTLYAVAICAAP